ncbi:hypothetical protein BH11ACT2_BH11ACT2_19780 [soil metagenome]
MLALLTDRSITLTRAGSYSIITGNFRQMPSVGIYVANGSTWHTIKQQATADPLCLIGAALCDLVTLTGTYGSY